MSLVSDVRYGVRKWSAVPWTASFAILSVALGTGVTLALAAVCDSLYFRPLPVFEPDRLLKVSYAERDGLFPTEFAKLVEANHGFRGVAATALDKVIVTSESDTRLAEVSFVSGSYFSLLGVAPTVGRTIAVDDDRASSSGVAVLGYAYWKSVLRSDPDAIGTTIQVGQSTATVIGVSAASFFGTEIGKRVDVFVPIAHEPLVQGRRSRANLNTPWLSLFARLEDGQGLDGAIASLRSFQSVLDRLSTPKGLVVVVAGEALNLRPSNRGESWLRNQFGTPLLVLLAVVIAVLLLTCANLSTVIVSRVIDREHEIRIRRCLGASRLHILRNSAIEGVLLSLVGTIVGMLIAAWLGQLVVPLMEAPLDRSVVPFVEVALDYRLGIAAACIVVVCGAISGLLPGILATSVRASFQAERSSGIARASNVALRGLLVTQIALLLTLLCQAVVLVQSFIAITRKPAGIEQAGVLLASVTGPIWGDTATETLLRLGRLIDETEALPGIGGASLSVMTPMSDLIMMHQLDIPGRVPASSESSHVATNWVTPRFLDVFGTPLLRGRAFLSNDTAGKLLVGIVNETFVSKYFDSGDAIGRAILLENRSVTIVGVVSNTKYKNAREPARAFVYLPMAQWLGNQASPPLRLAVKSNDTETARASIIAAVRRFDPDLRLQFRTLSDEIDVAVNPERLLAEVSGLYSVLAGVLVAIGLHGTLRYAVERRRKELAVRIAIGATSESISWLVLKDGLLLAGAGIVAGSVLVFLVDRSATAMVPDLPRTSMQGLVIGAAIVVATTVIATLAPARQAAACDPADALKST